jgi:hypothetical protein
MTASPAVIRSQSQSLTPRRKIVEGAYAQMQTSSRPRGRRGDLVWPGLLRRLDRLDPSYRE